MKIKKGWKITWITLGSLLGLVVLLIGLAMWVVFTPSQLTKLVNRLAGNFLNCDAHFEYVDFTLISTFPDAGLKIKNVTLINRMDGAPNDTLAYIGDITIGIDLMAYVRHNKIIVHQIEMDNSVANLYIDKEGRCNFDIIPPSKDTTEEGEPLELVDLEEVEVKNLTARLRDERDGIDAELQGLALSLNGRIKGDDIKAHIRANCQEVSMGTKDTAGYPLLAAAVKRMQIGADVDNRGVKIDAETFIDGERLAITVTDTLGNPTLATVLDGLSLRVDSGMGISSAVGTLALKVDNGTFDMDSKPMVNDALQSSNVPLLQTTIPFHYSFSSQKLTLHETTVDIADVGLSLGGEVAMGTPMDVDLHMSSTEPWRLDEVLAFIPDAYASFRKGMEAKGKVQLKATAKGPLGNGALPVVDATLRLEEGSCYWPSVVPYRFSTMSGDFVAHLDMNDKGISMAKVSRLQARTKDSRLLLSGQVNDLLGKMLVDATLTGTLPLHDLDPVLPDGMDISAEGDVSVNAKARFAWDDLRTQNYEKMLANADMSMKEVDVDYNGMHTVVPGMDVVVSIPAKVHKNRLADVHITGKGQGNIKLEKGTMKLDSKSDNLDISLGVNNFLKHNIEADCELTIGETEALMDSTILSTGSVNVNGVLGFDSETSNPLASSVFTFSTYNATLFTPQLPEALRLTELEVDYKPELCEILSAQVKLGHTDLDLFGQVEDLEQWLAGKSMLKGYLNLTSEYADVDQMMGLFSGAGSNTDSLEAMRIEDTVPPEANPFIVHRTVDLTLRTQIKRSLAFGNDLHDLSGELTVKDGVAVLDQMGFVCKAARMQLTAIYKSPRPNNLFASIDFHLLDIQIDELLDMIPCVDTLVPMLKAFDGNANFHLAGESFLDAFYHPKMSSLLGSAAISGENLTVMEDKSLANIARLIGLKKWKDKDNKIKIDSLSVEMTCFRKEIEVYPFLLNMNKYSFCISGVHTLDNLCNYHIELLKNPLIAKIGVDVKGTLSDPKISLGSVRYGDFYKPEKKNAVSKKALELKSMIRRELERNVR